MFGLRLVMDNLVLSKRSGSGDTLPRRLNEVRRKINGGALGNTCMIHTHYVNISVLMKMCPISVFTSHILLICFMNLYTNH